MGFLALTRRTGEAVRCLMPTGDALLFRIGRISAGRVKIAIEAPPSVSIHRDAPPPLVSIGPGGMGHPDSREIGGNR